MNTAVINIKTEQKLKDQAQKIANEMGLSLTTVINRYLKHFIETKTITFEANDKILNARSQVTMKQAEENLKTGNHSPVFDNIKDELQWLKEQGI